MPPFLSDGSSVSMPGVEAPNQKFFAHGEETERDPQRGMFIPSAPISPCPGARCAPQSEGYSSSSSISTMRCLFSLIRQIEMQ